MISLPAAPSTFHKAASGLRGGDALHLAVALEAKVKHILTLDAVFARNAKAMKLIAIAL
jgi:predicted nucleic acid-binding protein